MKLVLDVDGVIAWGGHPYANCKVYPEALDRVKKLKVEGHEIYWFTARYMLVYNNDQMKAIARGYYELKDWMDRHGVPYDGIFLGKPVGDLYGDDLGFRIESRLGMADWDRLEEFIRSNP